MLLGLTYFYLAFVSAFTSLPRNANRYKQATRVNVLQMCCKYGNKQR